MTISPRRPALVAALLVLWCPSLHAQGAWDAILNIDPYPSPYYSDWDGNPNIATLTVINTTMSAQQVRIHFNVTNRANRLVISGSSDPQPVGAGATVIFDNPYDIAGNTQRDGEEEEIASRTGRLREGDYTACAVVADPNGFSLAESCSDFTIVYPDPPLLLGPDNGEVITQTDPLFQWTPVQVPIDFQLSYVMRIVEVFSGQTPAEALRANIPHYQELDGQFPSLRYPLGARSFEAGKEYAWTVQVLDQNGYAASGNDGRSEIWTFRYEDGSVVAQPPASSTNVRLTIRNVPDPDDAQASREADEMSVEEVTELYTNPPAASGLGQICSAWGDPKRVETIVFPVMSQFAFPNLTELPRAILVRDTLSDDRLGWAVTGSTDNYTVMLTGGCLNGVTVARWVGIRTTGDAQEVSSWIFTDSVTADPVNMQDTTVVVVTDTLTGETRDSTVVTDVALPKLKFGVAIFSLFEEVAGAEKDSIDIVRAFLEDHEIQVKPGINLYGVLDLRQYPDVWDKLSIIYEDDEHEAELQGYLGINNTVAVRIGTKGAAVALEQEFLVLRAALPKKNKDGFFKTTQWGFEIAFGDSMAAGKKWGGGNIADLAFNLKPKLTFTGVTRGGDPAWLLPENVTWNGSLEVNFGLSPVAKSGERFGVTRTLRLKTDREFRLGSTPFALGHPEIFVDVNNSILKALLVDRRAGRIDVDVNGRASVVLSGQEIATGHLTIGRKGSTPSNNLQRAQQLAGNDSLIVASYEELVRSTESEIEERKTKGDTTLVRISRDKLARYKADLEKYKKSLRLSRLKVAQLEKPDARRPLAKGSGAQDPSKDPNAEDQAGKWFGEFTMSFGNMGLANLFDVLGAALGWSK